jgi:crotonobetainyl-CoA:carnitine CoA-transferase CaiB-like acyl-CoA transferase
MPQVQARQMRLDFEQQGFGGGRATELGIPIKFRHEPGQVQPEIPTLGQHTHEVLSGLGLDEQTIKLASGQQ